MYMSAYFLASLGRAKGSYHRHLRRRLTLRASRIATEHRIEVCWGGLVVVDAVQTEAECVHDDTALSRR